MHDHFFLLLCVYEELLTLVPNTKHTPGLACLDSRRVMQRVKSVAGKNLSIFGTSVAPSKFLGMVSGESPVKLHRPRRPIPFINLRRHRSTRVKSAFPGSTAAENLFMVLKGLKKFRVTSPVRKKAKVSRYCPRSPILVHPRPFWLRS